MGSIFLAIHKDTNLLQDLSNHTSFFESLANSTVLGALSCTKGVSTLKLTEKIPKIQRDQHISLVTVLTFVNFHIKIWSTYWAQESRQARSTFRCVHYSRWAKYSFCSRIIRRLSCLVLILFLNNCLVFYSVHPARFLNPSESLGGFGTTGLVECRVVFLVDWIPVVVAVGILFRIAPPRSAISSDEVLRNSFVRFERPLWFECSRHKVW